MGAGISELERCCNTRDPPEEMEGNSPRAPSPRPGPGASRSAGSKALGQSGPRGHHSQQRRAPLDNDDFPEPNDRPWGVTVSGRPPRTEVRFISRSRLEDDLSDLYTGKDVRWASITGRPERNCPFPPQLDILVATGSVPPTYGGPGRDRNGRRLESRPPRIETVWVSGLDGGSEFLVAMEQALESPPKVIRRLEAISPYSGGLAAVAVFSVREGLSFNAEDKAESEASRPWLEVLPAPRSADALSYGASLSESLNKLAGQWPRRWIRHLLPLPNGDIVLFWLPSKVRRFYAVRVCDLGKLERGASQGASPDGKFKTPRREGGAGTDVGSDVGPSASARRGAASANAAAWCTNLGEILDLPVSDGSMRRLVGMLHGPRSTTSGAVAANGSVNGSQAPSANGSAAVEPARLYAVYEEIGEEPETLTKVRGRS